MRPDYEHKGDNDTYVRFAAFVFGVNSQGQTTGTWYDMSKTTGNDATSWPSYYKCTYRGSATNIIFCYMDKNASANNWTNRWLQTYDLVVPSRPGDYGYIVTCRQILNGVTANGTTYSNPRNSTGINEDTGYGTNKLLGYWKHSYVNVKISTTTNSSTLLANTTYGDYYPSIINTSKTGGTAAWYNDDNTNHRVYVDGREYQDYDSSNNIIAHQKYDKYVMLSAKDNSYYLFKGWYSNAAGTTALPDVTYNGVSYTYQSKDYPIQASNNNAYNGSDTVKTDNYYAKFEERPETWQIKYGTTATNWSTTTDVTLTNSSGSTYTGTVSLTHGQEIWFKVYNYKTGTWYGNGGDYSDYIKTTLVSGATLTTSGGNIHIKSGFAGTATYTFSFNSSNKQLTITASGTVPTVTLWNNNQDGGTGNHITMSRSSTSSNVMTCTKTLTEGQEVWFKVNDQTSSIWYTNRNGTTSGYYDGYTTTPLVSNSPLGTASGNNTNMYIHAHAGTYKFSFDYSTKQLTIAVTSWSDITITVNYNGQSWFGGSGAKIYFYADTGDMLMSDSTSTTKTITVKSNVGNGTNVGFNRKSSSGTFWNNWNAGSRGFKTTYKITGGDNQSSGTGYWDS